MIKDCQLVRKRNGDKRVQAGEKTILAWLRETQLIDHRITYPIS